jgi:cation diffusion facilitator family transporter
MSEKQGRRRAIGQLLLASLWLTLLVLAMKLWIGWATQSLSLIAQSLHTLIASFSLLLSLIATTSPGGVQRELWGHSKLEAILALLLTAILGFACFNLAIISVYQLEAVVSNSAPLFEIQVNPPLLQLLGVITATSFCLACLGYYQAGKMDSIPLRLGANHLFQDVWLLLLLLAGLVAIWQKQFWVDPLLAIVLVLAAIANCWWVLNRQLPSLLKQVAIAPEALAQTVHQVEGITHCYAIRTRGMAGRQILVEMRLILHPEYISIARTIAERVERTIRERYGPARVIIHIDGDQSGVRASR